MSGRPKEMVITSYHFSSFELFSSLGVMSCFATRLMGKIFSTLES
jgi:hypothetical protein